MWSLADFCGKRAALRKVNRNPSKRSPRDYFRVRVLSERVVTRIPCTEIVTSRQQSRARDRLYRVRVVDESRFFEMNENDTFDRR